MKGRQVGRVNQQSKSETPLMSGVLQRTAVRAVADKEVKATEDVESGRLRESRFRHDFSQVGIDRGGLPPIQAKLTIGEPGDKYEQEADRVASQVVQQINAPASVQSSQGQSVQRTEAPEEEEIQAKLENTSLQRKEKIAGGQASTDVDRAIYRARGGGLPLEEGLQRSMGQAMGADFRGVKIHKDAQSDQLNRLIEAKAFTTGQDVFFRQGAYEPESRGGQELIAHELTHVVQQKAAAANKIQRWKEGKGSTKWSENDVYATFKEEAGKRKSEKLGSDQNRLPALPGVTWSKDGEVENKGQKKDLFKPEKGKEELVVPRDCITTAELVSAWIMKVDPEKIGTIKTPPTVHPVGSKHKVKPGEILFHLHDEKRIGEFHAAAVVAEDGKDVVTMEADRSIRGKIGAFHPIFDMYEGHAGFSVEQNPKRRKKEKTYVFNINTEGGRVEESLWKGISDDIKKGSYFKTGEDAAEGIKAAIMEGIKNQGETLVGSEGKGKKRKREGV